MPIDPALAASPLRSGLRHLFFAVLWIGLAISGWLILAEIPEPSEAPSLRDRLAANAFSFGSTLVVLLGGFGAVVSTAQAGLELIQRTPGRWRPIEALRARARRARRALSALLFEPALLDSAAMRVTLAAAAAIASVATVSAGLQPGEVSIRVEGEAGTRVVNVALDLEQRIVGLDASFERLGERLAAAERRMDASTAALSPGLHAVDAAVRELPARMATASPRPLGGDGLAREVKGLEAAIARLSGAMSRGFERMEGVSASLAEIDRALARQAELQEHTSERLAHLLAADEYDARRTLGRRIHDLVVGAPSELRRAAGAQVAPAAVNARATSAPSTSEEGVR